MTRMRRWPLAVLMATCLAIVSRLAGAADEDDRPLEGVWVGQSMEADGKPAPAETARRMRFTFKGDKLFIRGNFDGDREEECACKIDAKQTPNHLDFTPPKEKKPVLGILEVKGDDLKICLRHASSDKGRPEGFATKEGSQLVLIVFKKQKP